MIGTSLSTSDIVHAAILIATLAVVLKIAQRADFAPLPTILTILAAVAVNYALGTGTWIADLLSGDGHAAVDSTATADRPADAPPTLRQALGALRPLLPLMLIAGTAVSVLIVLVGCAARIGAHTHTTRALRRRHLRQWATLSRTHNQILGQWHRYLLDTDAQLRSPVPNDVTLPQTQEFLDAVVDAEAHGQQTTNISADMVGAYTDAVQQLQLTWTRIAPDAQPLGLQLPSEPAGHGAAGERPPRDPGSTPAPSSVG